MTAKARPERHFEGNGGSEKFAFDVRAHPIVVVPHDQPSDAEGLRRAQPSTHFSIASAVT
jgi:hypothetical protein